jgi:hypothetical protein
MIGLLYVKPERKNMKTFIRQLLKLNLKLPIFLSSHVSLREISGHVVIDYPVRTGLIQIGFGKVGIFDYKKYRSIWEVSGTVVFK